MRAERREDILKRLRCIEGHARGVARMVDTGADCLAVVRQVKALQGALDKVAQLVVRDHLTTCLPAALDSQDPSQRQRALMEVGDVVAAMRLG